MKRQLKLYVWEDVLNGYTSGIAFALAETEEEARQLITKEMGYNHEDLNKKPELIYNKKGFYIYGGG